MGYIGPVHMFWAICSLYICMYILVSLVNLSVYVEDWFEGDAHTKLSLISLTQ